MLHFTLQEGIAVEIRIAVKENADISKVWYSLVCEQRKHPFHILKVVPSLDNEHELELLVTNDMTERIVRYLPTIGCAMCSVKDVRTARPLLVASDDDVVVLPAIRGVFDSDIEYS